jgi:hypothetical protein
MTVNVGTLDGEKFSSCMRKHGVMNYPDPNSQGLVTINSRMGINPDSPVFSAAQATCQKLLPDGGQPAAAQIAQRQQQLRAVSACMRAHGIKDFPDPSSHGLVLHGGPGSDLNPNNPLLLKAFTACQPGMPAPTPGG